MVGDLFAAQRIGVIDQGQIEFAIGEIGGRAWRSSPSSSNVTFDRSRRTATPTSLAECSCPVTADPNLSASTIPRFYAASRRSFSMANPQRSTAASRSQALPCRIRAHDARILAAQRPLRPPVKRPAAARC